MPAEIFSGVPMRWLIVLALPLLSFAQTCEELNCPVCCSKKSNGGLECSESSLTCQLKSSLNYDSFMTVVVISLGVFFGLPLVFKLFEILVWWRIPGIQLSFLELILFVLKKTCGCQKNAVQNEREGSSTHRPQTQTYYDCVVPENLKGRQEWNLKISL